MYAATAKNANVSGLWELAVRSLATSPRAASAISAKLSVFVKLNVVSKMAYPANLKPCRWREVKERMEIRDGTKTK